MTDQATSLAYGPDELAAVELDESSPLGSLAIVRRLLLPAGHEQRLVVSPLVAPGQIGTTTVDLRLGTEWEAMSAYRFQALDPGENPQTASELLQTSVEEFRVTAGQRHGLVLHPGDLLLALTLEYLSLPRDLWGQLEGRSTWARQGLQVHATAGMVDAGFEGYLTLELQNTGRIPLVLYPGLRVAQMAFFPVRHTAYAYSGKPNAAYSGQTRARSQFVHQPEHNHRHAYVQAEAAAERMRQAMHVGITATVPGADGREGIADPARIMTAPTEAPGDTK
jgi:dCTP deaminase